MRFLGLFVLFTFIPALYGLPVLERGCFKKVCLLRVLLIIITSLTVPIAAWFVLRKYHWYEYLLLDSVVANFLSTILIPFFENRKKFSYKNVLRFFCFFALSVALYSTLTFGQTLINSDAATATILADSQLRHKSLFPATWNYANGEIWVFAINIVTMPFIRFVKNQSLARMFGSVIWISMACTSVVFLAKKLLKDSSWLISVPFLVLFFTGFENLDSVDMILYQAAYIGQVTLLCIPLTLFWYNYSNFQNKNDNAISEKRKYLILLTFMFLIFLFSLGGIRFIVEFILPLLITICIFSLIETPDFDLKKIKELVFLLIAIIIPSVIGFVFYKKLCFTHNVNNSKNFSLFFCGSTKEYWNNFQGVFINHFENFGFSPNVSVISIAGLKNFAPPFFWQLPRHR